MSAGFAQCRGCKRRLKNPSPSGYGPVCERRLGLTPAKPRRSTPRRAKPATVPPAHDELPGQDALPLFHHQATLWSL